MMTATHRTTSLVLLIILAVLLAPNRETRAQTLANPSALNAVNLCPFNPGDAYSEAHRVWGATINGTPYALVSLTKNGAPGLAVINTTNLSSPSEEVFFEVRDPDFSNQTSESVDVRVYQDSGDVYAYVAQEHGGIQVINVGAAISGSPPENVPYGQVPYYGDRIWPLDVDPDPTDQNPAPNPLPAGMSFRPEMGGKSQAHTVDVAGNHLFIATQTRFIDVWYLGGGHAMSPVKAGVIELSVGIGDNPLQEQTELARYDYTGTPVEDTVSTLLPGVHEVFAEPAGGTDATLYAAFTRGGLQVLDVSLPTPGTHNNVRIWPNSVQKQVYDNDREHPAVVDSDDPYYDFRNTHTAWPVQGGDYVVTTDEHVVQGAPRFDPLIDLYPPIGAFYDADNDQVLVDNNDTGLTERYSGEAAYKRYGSFVRIWNTNNLGTSSALVAGYDVPETVASEGVTSLSAVNVSDVPNSPHTVVAQGDLLYVAGYTQGVRVVDVSNPSSPVEVGYYDPIAPLTTGSSRNYRPGGNYLAGMYDVYPDPSRPGVVYATSREKQAGVGFNGVNMVRYVGETLDVDIPHDVALKGSIAVPTSVNVKSGATVGMRQGTTLNFASNADLTVNNGGEFIVDDATVFNMGTGSRIRVYGQLAVNGTGANPVFLRRTGSGTWDGIYFGSGAYGLLDHVRIEDVGFSYAAVTFNNADGVVRNSTITNVGSMNGGIGVMGYAAQVDLLGNTITMAGGRGVYVSSSGSIDMQANTIGGGGYTGVEAYGGTVSFSGAGGADQNGRNTVGGFYNGVRATQSAVYGGSYYSQNGSRNRLLSNSHDTYCSTSGVIYMVRSWWGSSSGPRSQDVYSDNPQNCIVYYSPYLSNDPGVSNMVAGGTVASMRAASDQDPEAADELLVSAVGLVEEERHEEAKGLLKQLLEREDLSEPVARAGVRLLGRVAQVRRGPSVGQYLGRLSAKGDARGREARLMLVTAHAAAGRAGAARALARNLLEHEDRGTAFRAGTLLFHVLLDEAAYEEARELLSELRPEREEEQTWLEVAETLLQREAERTSEVAPAPPAPRATLAEAAPSAVTTEAYPNPFNPRTTIRYALPEQAEVRLAVYDVLGRQVAVLADGVKEAGAHEAVFDATQRATGIYVYRLEAGDVVQTGKLLLVK